nr:InlB B-repeat-containing protein [Clostridia bacterium]
MLMVAFVFTGCTEVSKVLRFKYTATFVQNDDSGVITVQNVRANKFVNEPTAPTYQDHTFLGWYTAEEGGELVVFPYLITDDTVFYAHWQSALSFTVNFITGDGLFESVAITEGHTVDLPETPTRDGYTFLGWSLQEDECIAATFPYVVNEETTFYAHWEAVTFNVDFNPTGG